jgi:hypothetical protein
MSKLPIATTWAKTTSNNESWNNIINTICNTPKMAAITIGL